MDNVGQDLLAHAALAGDEHAGFGRREKGGIAQHGAHERAAGHHEIRNGRFTFNARGFGFGDADGLAHGGEQFIKVNGFGQIVHRAIPHGGDGIANVGVCCHEQHGQRGVLLAREAESFQAAQPGHPDVGNHEIKFSGAQQFQGAFAGIGGDGLEILACQEGIQEAALAGVVIHDQDARQRFCVFVIFQRHASIYRRARAAKRNFRRV